MKTRMERLQELMAREGIDAVALIPGANLLYMTGIRMHTSERVTLALLTRDEKCHVLLPALEAARAASQANIPIELYTWSDEEGTQAGWTRLRKDLDLAGCTIAVEY